MYAVFDIGGTHLRIGVANNFESILDSIIIKTPQEFGDGIKLIGQSIRKLSNSQKITACFGGLAGPLDTAKKKLVESPHLSHWVGKPFVDELSKEINAPVSLENDSALGGVGEAVYGAGKGYKIVSYLCIGTGVGGAKIVGGKIDDNAFGFEPGHQIIEINGQEDTCGKKGHLEAYISGSALKKIYGKPAEQLTDKKIWMKVAQQLAVGINNIVTLWSPDIIVVSGSVGMRIDLGVVRSCLKDIMSIFPKSPEIVYGALGNISGLYGGLAFLKR